MATRTLAGVTALLQDLELDAIPEFPSADPLHRPVDVFHAYLADTLQKLVGCDPQHAYDAIQPANMTSNGDLDIVLPKLKLPGDPDLSDLAADLVKNFPNPHPLFLVPWRDGIHVRFFLSPKILPRILLPYIIDRGPSYGILRVEGEAGSAPAEKNAIIEFSSPNLGPVFRSDHLRSTVLGAFVANVYDAMGWQVVRVNYLGDWGQNIGLLGLGWIQHGSKEALEEHPEPFRLIHEIYTKMEEELKPKLAAKKEKAREKRETAASDEPEEEEPMILERAASFKRLEDGDPPAVELWDKLRSISVDYYSSAYRRLGIVFDNYSGESLVCRNAETLGKVEGALKDKGVAEQAPDGSWIVDFSKHGAARLGTDVHLRSKDGTTTYFLRDVATAIDRLENRSFDKFVYVVGEQDLHFRQVFKTLELLGYGDAVKSKLQHLVFTRGPPQWGEERILGDILDRCEEYIQRAIAQADPPQLPPALRTPATLKTMAVNSLIAQELSTRNKAHTVGLDIEMLMSTEEQTGLNLQLSYARLCLAISELEAGQQAPFDSEASGKFDYSALSKTPWVELLRLLVRFPAVTSAAFKSLEPSTVLTYLFQVADELGFCLDDTEEQVSEAGGSGQGGNGDVQTRNAARAMLFRGTRQVLENGMRLLNMTPFLSSNSLEHRGMSV